jgi:hypothetical protein
MPRKLLRVPTLVALYDYRTGNKTLFQNVQIGKPYDVSNPYSGFSFGGIEYDDFNDNRSNDKTFVLSTQPAAAVFYEDEHYLVTFGLRVLKLPLSGITEDMNFQLQNVRYRKIEFHKGGVTGAYKDRLYICQLIVERDICYSAPFKKNEFLIRNKGMMTYP